LVPSPSERSQVPHHRPILGGNQGAGTVTYSYCQQVGHLLNHCPLRQLLKEKFMNIHQHVFPTTTIVVPNVSVLGTQGTNPSINYTIVLVNYQTTWSQPITPIVPSKISMLPTSLYPMWYNVIPPFVPLDPNCIQHIQLKQKDLIPRFLGIIHVPRNVYPVLEQHVAPPIHTPYFVRN
jgi:hypothetical protein